MPPCSHNTGRPTCTRLSAAASIVQPLRRSQTDRSELKVCVTFLPTPSFILLLQLTTSAVAVWAMSSMGVVSTERMEMAKAKKYMLVVACFAGFLYCNVKALQVRRLPQPWLPPMLL